MTDRPTGTVTFLFSDLIGGVPSGHDEAATASDVAHSLEVLRAAVTVQGGYLYKVIGTTCQVAFATARAAVLAACETQRALAQQTLQGMVTKSRVETPEHPVGSWRAPSMALHTGVTQQQGEDYAGPLLNRVARLLAAAHPGQTLLSAATAGLMQDDMPAGTGLRSLGEHRLKDLIRPELIYQLVVPDLPADFPPPKTLTGRANNLPLQPTAAVGRARELADCLAALRRAEVRLYTLTGPGGTGKTRLALQLAAEMLDDCPDGVFFVDLAPVAGPDLVTSSIASVLGVPESGGETLLASLKGYLRDKRLLLVLDNFEHLLSAAPLTVELLEACAQLKQLVTSRARLRVSGEHEVRGAAAGAARPRTSGTNSLARRIAAV